MKFAQICLLALTLTLAACQNPAPVANNKPPAANNNAAAKPAAATSATTLDLSTPTKTAIAFYQGVKNKDVEKSQEYAFQSNAGRS
jgi:uncharacterized lipoprotein YajG